MTKEQFSALWNADSWEEKSYGVYLTAHRAGKELHINCGDYTEAEVLVMPFWERLVQELDELDRQAHEILQKEFPDDEEIADLSLTDISMDKSGCYGTFPSVTMLGIHRLGNSISMCPLTSSSYPARRLDTTPFDTGRLSKWH